MYQFLFYGSDTLQVGPHRYTVTTESGLLNGYRVEHGQSGAVGFCDPHRLMIVVDGSLASSQVKECVFHEAKHALWAMTNLPPGGAPAVEEDVISRQSPFEIDLLRRNPRFAQWLLTE